MPDRQSFDLLEADGAGVDRLCLVSDVCFCVSCLCSGTLCFVLGSTTEGGDSWAVYVGINTLVGHALQDVTMPPRYKRLGLNVKSELPSPGVSHVMREVLMFLPGRAMACAG